MFVFQGKMDMEKKNTWDQPENANIEEEIYSRDFLLTVKLA